MTSQLRAVISAILMLHLCFFQAIRELPALVTLVSIRVFFAALLLQ